VIYERANSSFAGIQTSLIDWEKVFEGTDWFHWTGIMPAVSEGAAEVFREAIQVARGIGVTVSCDLIYRAK
jgi:2-dehydro-3-deoxygluconokinase